MRSAGKARHPASLRRGTHQSSHFLPRWLLALGAAVIVAAALIPVAILVIGDNGPPVEQTAPDFTLTSAEGGEVSLLPALDDHAAVVLVFYRGFF